MNPFDQFDQQPVSQAANPFDQFDNKPQDQGFMSAGAKPTQDQDFSTRVASDNQRIGDETVQKLQNPNLNDLGRAAIDAQTGLNSMLSYPKEGIAGAYGALPNNIKGAISSAGTGVKNAVTSAWNALPDAARNTIASDSKSALNWLQDQAYQHPNTVGVLGVAGTVAPAAGVLGKAAEAAPGAMKTLGEMAEDIKAPTPPETPPPSGPSPPMYPAGTEAPPIGEGQIRPRNLPQITQENQNLADNTSAAYAKAHELGFGFTDEGGSWFANKVKDATEDATGGLDKQNHPATIAALKTLANKADDGLDLMGMDKVRQTLGRIAQNTNPDKANEVYAANAARRAMDSTLGEATGDPALSYGSSDAVSALEDGRAAHALQAQHSDIRDIVRKAAGNGNKIQAGFKKIYDDEDYFNSFSPENQAIIDKIAKPNLAMNALKVVGNVGLGAGGNKWAVGADAAAMLLNPAAAGTAMGLGTASNVARNLIIRKGADQVLKNIEGKSIPLDPFYGQSRTSYLGQKALPAPAEPLALPAPQRPMISENGAIRPMTDEEWERSANMQNDPHVQQGMGATEETPRESVLQDQASRQRGHMTAEEWNKRKQQGLKTGGKVNTVPTEAQKQAGNYKKDHITLHGLNITIENPKGSIRRGVDKNGKKWQVKMPAAYGYIKRSEGADGDYVDCYVGPRPNSKKVWIVDQKNTDDGKFDEHKVFIGFPTKSLVLATYRKAFSDGKADQRIHGITEVTIDELKHWLETTMRKVA